MTTSSGREKKFEEALRGLARLVKAVHYYPTSHPALNAAVQEVYADFRPLLEAGENLGFAVRKEGFQFEGAVTTDQGVMQKLALFLFARRIHQVLVLADLSSRDLLAFARCLTLTPADLLRLGGIQAVLTKAKVSTLWVNEMDLTRILPLKQEIEAEKKALPAGAEDEGLEQLLAGGKGAAEPAPRPEERGLERVLNDLERAPDDRTFRLLLQELLPLLRLNLTEGRQPLVLRALLHLCRNCLDPKASAERRNSAREGLGQIVTEEMVDFLLSYLCDRGLTPDHREKLIRVLAFFREKTVRPLMHRLAGEEDSQARRSLAEVLIRQGSAAAPLVQEFLGDERWYVVRNAVVILGEIREPSAIAHLSPQLAHEDLRVRREVIRAMTKIGGPAAIDILLGVVEEEDPEMSRQALLALGAMKSPAAVPTLLQLVGRPDPWLRRAELTKGAVKALGEIGSAEAVPVLQSLLRRRSFWYRSRVNEIRAAAAAALGEIAQPSARPALEAAAQERSLPVARAAAQALRQLKKGENHGHRAG